MESNIIYYKTYSRYMVDRWISILYEHGYSCVRNGDNARFCFIEDPAHDYNNDIYFERADGCLDLAKGLIGQADPYKCGRTL